MTTRTALDEAMHEGRRWQGLSFAATYLADELEKGGSPRNGPSRSYSQHSRTARTAGS